MNPFATPARLAGTFGLNGASEVLNAGLRAQRQAEQVGRQAQRVANALNTGGRTAKRANAPRSRGWSRPGLPAVNIDGSKLGATISNWRPNLNIYADVSGMPSVRIVELPDHSVEIHITLKSRFVRWMTQGDLAELRKLGAGIERDMRRLSRGRLTYKRLRKMNHPYGRGTHAKPKTYKDKRGRTRTRQRKRKQLPRTLAPKKYREQGITANEVINRHTGNLEQSWGSGARLTSTGALLLITNSATYAAALAMGTPLMRAHGPWTAIIALWRRRIMSTWSAISRRAWRRSVGN